MGSGKTSWAKELIKSDFEHSYLYIAPTLELVKHMIDDLSEYRKLKTPSPIGGSKLNGVVGLLEGSWDIASTHELFKRFDSRCKEALTKNKYTLILDETIDAVSQYKFSAKDDATYLMDHGDIKIEDSGEVRWTGSDELNTRFDDVRNVAQNHCLFRVEGNYFCWHFPVNVFELFDEIYLLTYNFGGSVMDSYLKMYKIPYELKSIKETAPEHYELVDYYVPDKRQFRERFDVYQGNLIDNLHLDKTGDLSKNFFSKKENRETVKRLRANMANYVRNVINAPSREVMWSTYEGYRKDLTGAGYARGFLPCNCRGSNDYTEKTCLLYSLNYFLQPEIKKWLEYHDTAPDQDRIALSVLLQWVWRSNIRVHESDKIIHLYLPAPRMRELFTEWINQ